MKTRRVTASSILAVIVATVLLVLQVPVFISAVDESSCTSADEDAGTCTAKSRTDEVGDKIQEFLQEKIFGQEDVEAGGGGFLSHLFNEEQEADKKEEEAENPFQSLFDRLSGLGGELLNSADAPKKQTVYASNKEAVLSSLLESVRELNEDDQSSVNGPGTWKIIQNALQQAFQQLHNTFGDILDSADASLAFAMMYFLAKEDSLKNSSWKRRQHRFNEPVTKDVVVELHDALYLSQLSYVNTLEEFREGLQKFRGNEFELAYGTTDSLPHLPAHFLLIHKHLSPLDRSSIKGRSFFSSWDRKKDSELTVTLVVRGTKHLSDAIADALLEPVAYRGGFAHGGLLASGKHLASKYLPKLQALLKHSGRDRIRLYLVGHSLGAAAASIAAMELKEHDDWMTVEALGFGCPSLLSPELSESTKDYITTVVADADVIPRMSGSSIANLLLDLIEYDWTDMALEDIEHTLEKARNTLQFGNMLPPKESTLEWVKTVVERDFKPNFEKMKKRERLVNVLIPPGNCLHFFRDGVGYSGVYTPCSFFSEVDLARTLVDDHLVMSGYHRALITIVRDWEADYNFDFEHDIAAIPC